MTMERMIESGRPAHSGKPQTDVRKLVVGIAENPASEVARQLRDLSSTIEAMRGTRSVIRVSRSLGGADDVGVIGIDGMQSLIYLACAELEKPSPIVHRATMQRRIKNQRAALRRLNRHIEVQNWTIERFRSDVKRERAIGYRHAAQLAETFWFGGRRIAAYIRKWI